MAYNVITVLASAAFVYVTAEMVPVGALPAIAADLRVSEALVGTLLASYALVAAVTTIPLVRPPAIGGGGARKVVACRASTRPAAKPPVA